MTFAIDLLAELRAEPPAAPHADELAAALEAVDIEGDYNPAAAALCAAIERTACKLLPLAERLRGLLRLLEDCEFGAL